MVEAAAAGAGLGTAPDRGRQAVLALAAGYIAEGERRLLWLPVFFGAGIGVYFSLTAEPRWWLGIAAAAVAGALALMHRRYPPASEAMLALLVFAAGFALAGDTTCEHQAPMRTVGGKER